MQFLSSFARTIYVAHLVLAKVLVITFGEECELSHHVVVFSGNLFFTHSLSRATTGSTISSTSLNLSSSHRIEYPTKQRFKLLMCILYRLRTVMAFWKTQLETERKQVSFPEGNALQFLTYFLPKHLNATLSKNFLPTLTTKNTSGTFCVHFFTDLTQWRLHVVSTPLSPVLRC